MIEKLNRVFEKLPPEHRDIIREAFTILIEEVINAVVKEIREGFKKQGEENERMWQNIERIWQAIDRLTKSIEETRKTMKEGFERQEKENERIWQNIERIWQAIEELRKDMKEGFERQAQENEKIWQAIEKTNERLDKLILAFEKAEKRNEQTRKQVGVLTDNFGYLLEDRAIRTLPKLLKERYGFEIIEPLRRDFIEINGKYIEVNIYGKARKNDEEFIIIVEAKTRITNKAIIGFLEKCNNFEGKQFRIMIGYLITPKIKQILENNNIIFINSYELEL
jgi:DNA repair exonuclease SbcCD ATPase subunit